MVVVVVVVVLVVVVVVVGHWPKGRDLASSYDACWEDNDRVAVGLVESALVQVIWPEDGSVKASAGSVAP